LSATRYRSRLNQFDKRLICAETKAVVIVQKKTALNVTFTHLDTSIRNTPQTRI